MDWKAESGVGVERVEAAEDAGAENTEDIEL